MEGGPPSEQPPHDPAYYALVIDNDSGTYRPNAKLLPQLNEFMQHNLPGMKVQTLDCQADEEKMNEMKTEQRERKKAEGKGIQFIQDSDGEISSSDEEDLDRAEAGGKGSRKQRAKKKARQPKTKLGQWVEGDREREQREEEDDMAGARNGQVT